MPERRCDQELCPYWSGDGQVCTCAVLDIDEQARAAARRQMGLYEPEEAEDADCT